MRRIHTDNKLFSQHGGTRAVLYACITQHCKRNTKMHPFDMVDVIEHTLTHMPCSNFEGSKTYMVAS